jgi:hypothetical protein
MGPTQRPDKFFTRRCVRDEDDPAVTMIAAPVDPTLPADLLKVPEGCALGPDLDDSPC